MPKTRRRYHKKSRNNRRHKSRRNRHLASKSFFYKGKGGSGCGVEGCPIAPLPMKGGSHGFYKPAHYISGPFVGSPWKGSVNNWPGVNGISGDKNYLERNMYYKDPQTMMKLYSGGGRRHSRIHRYRNRGGMSLIPQDLVNLGRSAMFNVGSAYNALNGYKPPVNPLPYKDQLVNSQNVKLI